MNLQTLPINYELLAKANAFYKSRGYTQIEVPWIVREGASMMTAPTKRNIFVIDDEEHLVGSAEQGFLQMIRSEEHVLVEQKLQAISPCFRREIVDMTHSQWFMKLELFYRIEYSDPTVIMRTFINDAADLFYLLGIQVEEVLQDDGVSIDLMHGKLELGSYGFREKDDIFWVFGTGIALPRAQLV